MTIDDRNVARTRHPHRSVLQVVVFNPFDYPDVTTGGLDEIIAMPRAETYIDISMTVFYSTEAILDFPVEKRNCLFPKEKSHEDDGAVYSYSNCILDCKIRDMQRNCGCRPFVYPRRGKRNCKGYIIEPTSFF